MLMSGKNLKGRQSNLPMAPLRCFGWKRARRSYWQSHQLRCLGSSHGRPLWLGLFVGVAWWPMQVPRWRGPWNPCGAPKWMPYDFQVGRWEDFAVAGGLLCASAQEVGSCQDSHRWTSSGRQKLLGFGGGFDAEDEGDLPELPIKWWWVSSHDCSKCGPPTLDRRCRGVDTNAEESKRRRTWSSTSSRAPTNAFGSNNVPQPLLKFCVLTRIAQCQPVCLTRTSSPTCSRCVPQAVSRP